MNAGHEAQFQSIAKTGVPVSKVWLAILDKKVLGSHKLLNGVKSAANGTWPLSDVAAPYPGHWSLPAAERINCRCTIISQFAFEQGAAAATFTEDDLVEMAWACGDLILDLAVGYPE